MELVVRDKISVLKKELNNIKATAEKEMLTLRHAVDKFTDALIQKAQEQSLRSSEAMYDMQKNLESEAMLLKSQFQQKIKEKQGEAKQVALELQGKLEQTEQQLRAATQEKEELEQELDLFHAKFKHLKEIIRVVARFVPISSEIQQGLLHESEENVERSLDGLRQALQSTHSTSEERSSSL
jgi:SMC interacting uncharacterized protein involved in chromosome segregation